MLSKRSVRPAPRFTRSPDPTDPALSDQQLFDLAVSALAARSRSETELRRFLVRKVGPHPHIDQVLVRLRELRYLSDEQLCQNVVETRQKHALWGARRVSFELLRRGVAEPLVEQTVAAVYSGVDELAQARAFAEKKRLFRLLAADPGQSPPKQVARFVRSLYRAGFSIAVCYKLANRPEPAVPEDDLA